VSEQTGLSQDAVFKSRQQHGPNGECTHCRVTTLT
jgi:hypothetical protein